MGVRMLVPLIDMINHGGDQTASGMLADPDRSPTDNVRQDRTPPDSYLCFEASGGVKEPQAWYTKVFKGHGLCEG